MGEVDKRNRLAELVFTYQVSKDRKVFIFWGGKRVKILKDDDAARFLARIAGLDDRGVQLALAKVTGNFKRGNER